MLEYPLDIHWILDLLDIGYPLDIHGILDLLDIEYPLDIHWILDLLDIGYPLDIHSILGDSTLAPWSEFGREVGDEDCFGDPPLEFAGRRSTEGDEGSFVQQILDLVDCELDEN